MALASVPIAAVPFMATAVNSLGLNTPAPCRGQLGREVLDRITRFALVPLQGCFVWLGRLLAKTESAIAAV